MHSHARRTADLFAVFCFLTVFFGLAASALRVTVSSPEDLLALAAAVNGGDEAYDGAEVVLTKDLDMEGYAFTPVGTGTHPFTGTFDGGGHVISGVTITSYTEENVFVEVNNKGVSYRRVPLGFFGRAHNAVIRDLGLRGVTFDVTAQTGDSLYAGLLCGYFSGDTDGGEYGVERCFAAGELTATSFRASVDAGGLIGRLADTGMGVTLFVKNVHADADVCAVAGSSTLARIGGIVGNFNISQVFSTAVLSRVRYAGALSGKGAMIYAGGVCGWANVDNSWGVGELDWEHHEIVEGTFERVLTDATGDFDGNSVYAGSVIGYTTTVSPVKVYTNAGNAFTVGGNKYPVAGTGVSLSQFSNETFLSNTLGFDMATVWRIADGLPVLRTAEAPLTVKTVSRESGTLAVTVCCGIAESGGKLFCAIYDAAGRLLDTGIVSAQSESTFSFADRENAAFVKAFLLDGDCRPLCPAASAAVGD